MSTDLPFRHVALRGGEGHSDFRQPAAVNGVGDEVAFGVYLFERFFYGAVQLNFHHVDVVRRLHHDVNAAFRRAHLRLGVDAQQ